MSTVIDIAEAVKAELNAPDGPADGDPPAALAAERLYRPRFELTDMGVLHVTVVPKGLELTAAGRGLAQDDVQIDVAVQKKLATTEAGEIDALMALVERIGDFLRQRRLAGAPDAAWVRTENVPVYSVEHLGELRQFTSVLTVTYRVMR